MGKKAKQKLKQAIVAPPIDDEVQTEAAYYARKCGITPEEAVRIIEAANRSEGRKGAPALVSASLRLAR
ncbi:hypothetical protein [Mesorhizobium sp. ES1-4]|uniref:hypothetical protein n=1 Tax=Mesorhizobium sp. ES1-4 TaxID=2876627 RepID=UPI001CCD6033|nr:hypothetical protein [Mesorhizobium sp. ES1-4]MBZ9799593.1 hypothetical protein [Mesorhizobium sp. ES1-4]